MIQFKIVFQKEFRVFVKELQEIGKKTVNQSKALEDFYPIRKSSE
jgi:hypothetical protein